MLGDIEADAITQQATAGTTGASLADQVGPGPSASSVLTGYLDDIPGSIPTPDDLTRTSITKPKKVSTEFVENTQDQIQQQTAGVLGDIGRTGKFSGIKDILQSADQSSIAAQEKGAAMDADYQKQLTDIEKFEAQALTDQEKFEQSQATDIAKFEEGLTSQITQAIGGQEFAGDQDWYDLAGNAAIASATAGGELEAAALAGQVELAGQEAAAWADIIGAGINAIIDMINPFGEKGMIIEDVENQEKEYNREGEESDMIQANEAEVTPGKFSHEENPIDIVHKRDNGEDEKIGEMTGGEGIMPPKDMIILEEMVQENDKDGVFEHMEYLLSRWEAIAKMHEEKKVPMQNSNELNRDIARARMGAKMGYKPKSRIKYRS